MRLAHLAALFSLLVPALAHADGCAIEKSSFGDPDEAYVLKFKEMGTFDPDSNVSLKFTLLVKGTKLALDGEVSIPREVSRTEGRITYQCPKDAEGDALAACTIWEGTMFGADKEGNISVLPPEGGDHAPQLILPGLGRAIRMSAIWGDKKATVAPWDVFAYTGCGK